MIYIYVFIFKEEGTQVSTRRRFDVNKTLLGRQQRCYNVETTFVCLLGLNLFLRIISLVELWFQNLKLEKKGVVFTFLFFEE